MSFVDTRRRFFSLLGISVLFIVVIGYGYFRAENLIRGPIISVIYPSDGETITLDTIVIHGKAKNVSHLYLNDRQIFINQEGIFREALSIPLGYTVVTIRGEDRFGKTKTVILRLGKEGPLTSTSTPSV